MNYTQPIVDLIRNRFSCRLYDPAPLDGQTTAEIERLLAESGGGPLGNHPRFALAAARPDDADALKGLGTYGMILGASAYIIGAIEPADLFLEDFGYQLEALVLKLTDLGLGSCWLGGTLTRSSFAERIGASDAEVVPAAIATGRIGNETLARMNIVRVVVGARRMAWNDLFFDGEFGRPLTQSAAGDYAQPLEMVRLGPSASNKQPWRVIRTEDRRFHFYLRRTAGKYDPVRAAKTGLQDNQRIDMGIAMFHFEQTAREADLRGSWQVLPAPSEAGEYTATWVAE